MNYLNNINHAYKDIYEQYIEDASFLWLMRSIAVEQPHYDLNDIKYLDQRIEAQLDGLMTCTDLAWELCEHAIESGGAGEIFTAAIIAFKSYNEERIQKVIEKSLISEECVKGITTALAWLPARVVHPWIKRFFTSKEINHKYIAIYTCHLRRENPGDFLNLFFTRPDCLEYVNLYALLLRISGELKRYDVLEYINHAINHDNEHIRFWSIWSAILLGQKQSVIKLQPYVLHTGPFQERAIKLAFRVLPVEQARQWISLLAKNPTQTRNVIIATGVMGDPQAVDWLLIQMQDVIHSRVAAEAFSMITGVNLEQALLTQDEPENFTSGPNDDPGNTDVKLDDDENLPWPNVTMVASYWNVIKAKYIYGHRYLLGAEINSEILINKKNNVFQRQRHAVALELAILDVRCIHENTSSKVVGSI